MARKKIDRINWRQVIGVALSEMLFCVAFWDIPKGIAAFFAVWIMLVGYGLLDEK